MADYAISNVPRRVVYAPSGVGPYAFTFEILDQTDIAVYKGSTLLTLTTDYTVTINLNGTGSVTLVATAGTDNITIVGAKNIQRTSDFTTGGDLFADTLNDELDNQTIFIQQVAETAERGLKAPVIDPTDINMTLPSKTARAGTFLAFDSPSGNPIAGPSIASVGTVTQNIANINTVAADIANVNTVATNIADVNTVAGISTDVSAVADIAADVTTLANGIVNIDAVANDITNINTVATNIASVNTVAGIDTEVTTVAGIDTEVTTVAGISADVSAVAAIDADVTTVAGIDADVTTVAGIDSDVTTVAGIAADVTAVAADATDIGTVATDLAGANNIGTVAGSIADINTLAPIAADITTVAGIDSDVTAVAADATDIGTVAGSIANVNTVAADIADVNTVAGISSNVTTVAGISANVTTVAGIDTEVTAVAGNSTNINTVAGISANVTTVAGISSDVTTVSGISANVTSVAGNATNINTVAGISSDVTTVATNVTDITNYSDTYLGAKATDPTVRNDSSALQAGDLYFNTADDVMKVYSGSAWIAAFVSLSGALIATNNLSDLTNASTARTNLGVVIGTDVQAWDADLDTWATKTAPSGTVVGDSDTQTLTNKTLTSPVVDKITDASGGVLAPISSVMRNRIINGAMVIDQRNAGASVTVGTGAFGVDRFRSSEVTDGTATAQQSTIAPNGFSNSLLYTVTGTDASLGSTQYASIEQRIEGFNVADLGWGTASAKTITISFWVRSSVTGTYCVGLYNSGGARSYTAEYTINVADTWEQKTITVVGDTTGTWLTTNGIGVLISFTLAVGSSYQQTAGSWGTTSFAIGTSNQTNLMATNGATFYITGVQLEVGTQATSFEYRQIQQELSLCQRYLPAYRHDGQNIIPSQVQFNSSTGSRGMVSFPVPTRVPVTGMVISSAGHFTAFGFAGGNGTGTAFTMHAGGTMGCGVDFGSSGFSTRDCATIGITNSSGFVYWTGAEL
jgi:hypothetical protein